MSSFAFDGILRPCPTAHFFFEQEAQIVGIHRAYLRGRPIVFLHQIKMNRPRAFVFLVAFAFGDMVTKDFQAIGKNALRFMQRSADFCFSLCRWCRCSAFPAFVSVAYFPRAFFTLSAIGPLSLTSCLSRSSDTPSLSAQRLRSQGSLTLIRS
jgi:hypothetical protein